MFLTSKLSLSLSLRITAMFESRAAFTFSIRERTSGLTDNGFKLKFCFRDFFLSWSLSSKFIKKVLKKSGNFFHNFLKLGN
jgi:hypothetical protein